MTRAIVAPRLPIMSGDLHRAAVELEGAQVLALVRGDTSAADRLSVLHRSVRFEAEYGDGVARCLPQVERRTAVPPGATIGWYLRHDPAVRAARQSYGLDADGGG